MHPPTKNEVVAFSATGEDLIERMAEGTREVDGFFAGMKGTEVAPGVVMYGTKDFLQAWLTWFKLKRKNEDVKAMRTLVAENEKTIMGDLMLPKGAEVVLADMPLDKSVAKITGVSVGFADRPLYEVFFRNPDGTYPKKMLPGENMAHVYARQLVDFGLTILQGKYCVG